MPKDVKRVRVRVTETLVLLELNGKEKETLAMTLEQTKIVSTLLIAAIAGLEGRLDDKEINLGVLTNLLEPEKIQ
jgi:hypothetical protein